VKQEMKSVVIGVGGAGCNIVNRMTGRRFAGIKRVYLDTDMKGLLRRKVPNCHCLGESVLAGKGASGDPGAAGTAANASKPTVLKAVGQAKYVVLVAGLGGGTGSGATVAIAEILNDGIRELGVVGVLPFGFEGPVRQLQAWETMQSLQKAMVDIRVVPNEDEKRERWVKKTTDFTAGFSRLNGSAIVEVMKILGRPTGG